MGETSSFGRWLPTHLRATRRSWLFLLVAAIGIVAIVEGARTVARVHDVVAPGVYFNLRGQVTSPLPDPARAHGIRLDDRIVAVDSQPVTSGSEIASRLVDVSPGTPVRLDLAPGDRSVVLEAFRPSLATTWAKYLVGAVFVLLGILLFWFHPGRRESWPFLFASVTFGLILLTTFALPRTTQPELMTRVSLVAVAALGPFFLHLFLVFPRPVRRVVRQPALLVALDLTGLAIGITGALVFRSQFWVSVCVRLATMMNALVVVLIISILVWRLRRPGSNEDRSKLRALLVALVISFPATAVFAVVVTFRWWIPATEVVSLWTSLLALCFPAIVGYAIVRRDLLVVDRAVARAALVSAIVGLFTLVFAGIALLLPTLVAPDVLGSPAAVATIALGGFVALIPVQRRVLPWLLSRFVTNSADAFGPVRDALTELADEPEPALFGRFERRLEEACKLADVALLVRDDDSLRRPATGERVEATTWPLVIDVRRDSAVVGAIALGRIGERVRIGPHARRQLAELAQDVGRALGGARKGEQIGGYKIERFLAAGGMGNVYVGTKHGAAGFVKSVAIKQLLPEMAVDKQVVERFLKEARLVARLSHPGIVQTLELGETGHGYFIAMELVDGIDAATLQRTIKHRRERLSIAIACHIVTSACIALEYAHRASDENGEPLRLVHHDVSPHNLLIDGAGNVKLADFGVAHVRHDPANRDLLVGKIGYMAPEQLRRDILDHRVDVFAAGVCLYELVTGQHPFSSGSDFLTLSAIEHGRFLPPETIREDLPLELVRTIERALAPEPRDRFQTAAAFAEAIQRVVPLSSRNAAELGDLVRRLRAPVGVVAPLPTVTLPTPQN